MVQLDDLNALVERGRLLSEVHHQDRPDGEVRRDDDADVVAAELVAQRVESFVGEAGGADHSVDPVLDTPGQVVHHRVRVGEVDDDVGSLDRRTVIARVDGGNQLQVLGRLDRSADFGAHPPS